MKFLFLFSSLIELGLCFVPMETSVKLTSLKQPDSYFFITRTPHRNNSRLIVNFSPYDETSITICASEGWRQYVPLVVSSAVILDILLGSPIANLALAPMRNAANEENGEHSGSSLGIKRDSFVKNSKERVDSDKIAQAALDKARNSVELRRFLDENKTDLQKAQEMSDKFDIEAQKFDDRRENL